MVVGGARRGGELGAPLADHRPDFRRAIELGDAQLMRSRAYDQRFLVAALKDVKAVLAQDSTTNERKRDGYPQLVNDQQLRFDFVATILLGELQRRDGSCDSAPPPPFDAP